MLITFKKLTVPTSIAIIASTSKYLNIFSIFLTRKLPTDI